MKLKPFILIAVGVAIVAITTLTAFKAADQVYFFEANGSGVLQPLAASASTQSSDNNPYGCAGEGELCSRGYLPADTELWTDPATSIQYRRIIPGHESNYVKNYERDSD